jgi:L-Ala-D/L-Glu epimerase
MHLSNLTIVDVQVPLRERFKTAVRETDVIDALEITLSATDGRKVVGYATATPAITGDSLESIDLHLTEVLRPLIIGRPIDTDEQILSIINDAQLRVTECSSAVAGIDQALRALRVNQPHVVGLTTVRTSVTIGAASMSEMLVAARSRLEQGFTVVKAKLGADPSGDAKRLIALAQELKGKAEFWVDANQGWTLDEALRILGEAGEVDALPTLLEQPVRADAIDDLSAIAHRVTIPVVADESARHVADIDRIAAAGGIAMINVKFMKFGGRTGAEVAVRRARFHDLGVIVGSMMEHPSSVGAAVAFAATLPESVHDLDAAWWADDPSPLRYKAGAVSLVPSAVGPAVRS